MPYPRGYHTACLYDKNKIIVVGGSDGQECFSDVIIFNTLSSTWSKTRILNPKPRLGHSAAIVGNYLFCFGGHNGDGYVNELNCLNLDKMEWVELSCFGVPPSPRGYHACVLHDARLFIYGGYDNARCYDEVHVLDLGSYAFLTI